MKPLTIYNIHAHIFTIYHVPEKYLPFGLVRLFKQESWRKIVLVAERLNNLSVALFL